MMKICKVCGVSSYSRPGLVASGIRGKFCSRVCFYSTLKGRKRTEEIRAKISLATKGNKNPFWGKTHSEATKQKISIFNTGKAYHKMPHTEETKEKLRQKNLGKISPKRGVPTPQFSGPNHWNWQGGKTSVNHSIRTSLLMKEWRRKVFERDNFTCQACGIRSCSGKKVYLHADHELPFAHFPDLRFEILNGRTLCAECHYKTPTVGNRSYLKATGIITV